MTRRPIMSVALAAAFVLALCTLAGCGQTGELYLPDRPREIVTRPTQAPPAPTTAPDSPHTVDSPPAADTPAPEVTAPVDGEKKDPDKNEKGAAAPPR